MISSKLLSLTETQPSHGGTVCLLFWNKNLVYTKSMSEASAVASACIFDTSVVDITNRGSTLSFTKHGFL